jgi:hypothetical protein
MWSLSVSLSARRVDDSPLLLLMFVQAQAPSSPSSWAAFFCEGRTVLLLLSLLSTLKQALQGKIKILPPRTSGERCKQ